MKAQLVKENKSQGAANRSERATIIQQAKQRWGKSLTAKEKCEIDKIAKDIAKDESELKVLVENAGLGKLAKKGFLRNGQKRKLRASQLLLMLEQKPESNIDKEAETLPYAKDDFFAKWGVKLKDQQDLRTF